MKRIPAILLSIALVLPLGYYAVSQGAKGIYEPGTYSYSAQGFLSEVKVAMSFSKNEITDVTIDASGETPELGGAAAAQMAKAVVDNGNIEVDGVAGATFTSTAVKTCLAACLAQAKGEDVPAPPTPTPVAVATPAPAGSYTPGTYSASAEGFGGDVTVTATFTDSEITEVTIDAPDETPDIGGRAANTMAETANAAKSLEVDGVAGATFTSTAVKNAMAAVLAQAKGEAAPVTSEPPVVATPAPAGTYTAGTYTYTAAGFGGDVTVTMTYSDTGIEEVIVDAPDETPELGGKAAQKMVKAVNETKSIEVDGMAGATFTSKAIKAGLEACEAQAKGQEVAPPEPTPTPEPVEGMTGSFTAGTYTASAKGFGGDVTAKITVSATQITDVVIEGKNETPGIGAAALEPLAVSAKAKGENLDAVAGASLTSKATKEAVTAALAQAKGEAPKPTPTPAPTPAPTPKPTPTPAPQDTTGGKYNPGTYTSTSFGFGGDVTAKVTVDANSITDVVIEGKSETPGIGGAALEPLTESAKAKGADLDAVAGATYTSTAAKEAVAEALKQAAAGGSKPAPQPTPAPAGKYKPGTYTGTSFGFGGDVTATVTVDANSITDVVIEGKSETPGIGGAALEPLAESAMAKGADLDAVAGATYTSTAAQEAVAEALKKAAN